MNTVHGQIIKQFFDCHQKFNIQNRGLLLKLVVENLAAKMDLQYINLQWCKVIHESVSAIFPTEAAVSINFNFLHFFFQLKLR